jgi:hypothetical protein
MAEPFSSRLGSSREHKIKRALTQRNKRHMLQQAKNDAINLEKNFLIKIIELTMNDPNFNYILFKGEKEQIIHNKKIACEALRKEYGKREQRNKKKT